MPTASQQTVVVLGAGIGGQVAATRLKLVRENRSGSRGHTTPSPCQGRSHDRPVVCVRGERVSPIVRREGSSNWAASARAP